MQHRKPSRQRLTALLLKGGANNSHVCMVTLWTPHLISNYDPYRNACAAKKRKTSLPPRYGRNRAVWNSNAAGDDATGEFSGSEGALCQYRVAATVDDDLIAAVEGWRRAHGLVGQPEALGELVRLGLMSEVAKIYRLICRDESADTLRAEVFRRQKRHHRSKRWERKEHPLPTI